MSTTSKPVADEQVRLDMYRMMQEARLFEKRAQDLFLEGLIKGTSHLALGQEAVAAGFAAALRPEDLVYCTYRGHVHTLLRGAPMGALMAELMGRANGICGGKGGSMHLTDVSHGAMGSYAIVGAHMPIAAGAAWAAQERGTGQVVVCFFGDGTTNIGAFHEALNLAVVWQLPVVYVCENNLYMEYTPIGAVTAVANPAADRASAYGLEPVVVDGNDVDEVFETATRLVDRARQGGGPALVEAKTYRHGGHSRADPAKYRPDDEVKAWLARDPIPTYRDRLLASGVDPEALDRVEREALELVDRATEEAKAGPVPRTRGARDRAVGRRGVRVAELTYREAVSRAIAQEMERDASVYFIGEDVAAAGGVFKTTEGLFERFGPKRVRDTPISEQAIIGAIMGAAMNGLRPVAELMFSDFFAVCWDLIANQIAKTRYMTNGQVALPLVIRTANGGGVRFGAQHSQSVEGWAMAIPGLKVVVPSNPVDMIGLFAAAVRDPDPVIVVEPKVLYATKGEVPDGEVVDRLGSAKVLRQGSDVTIAALGAMVPRSLEAAEALAGDGIDAEVIDVRSLVPLDATTILESVGKTGRFVTVEESPRLCGWGAEVASIVAEDHFFDLDGPIVRITTPHIPLPAADALEDLAIPSAASIAERVSATMD